MTQTMSVAAKVAGKIRGLRWYICALLFFVTFLNYVDRVSLGAMAPLLKHEIGWDDAQFGWINFSFQLAYALMFPVAGRMLDRFGVRNGLAIGVVIWSVAAMSHSLATTALGFAVARFVLGLGEATNFPACVKAVAEWFPKHQRAFATGIFNTGTNFGAMLQGGMMALAVLWGWQAAFVAVGLVGFVWLAIWMRSYRTPEEHTRLSSEELALIRSDQEPAAAAVRIPWQSLLRYREAWAFCLAKMLTDPVWWFYLTWLPSYLQRERGVTLASAAGALAAIYLAADLGSVFGGWLPGFFIRRGWQGSKARLVTMVLFALGLPISALGVMAKDLFTAVALISVATACHQAWSANLFTVASDAFPKRAVASVVGFGGMCGAIGGLFMNLISGGMLQWLGSYTPLFIFAGVMHPVAWVAMRWLLGGSIKEVDVGAGLRTTFSPVLLGIGAVLGVVGSGLGVLVLANWSYLLEVTKGSVAAAAGGAAAAGMLLLMGLALSYASREVRVAGQ
jgi:ACS family hexuronate transporter-like MFS transporter